MRLAALPVLMKLLSSISYWMLSTDGASSDLVPEDSAGELVARGVEGVHIFYMYSHLRLF